MFYDENIQKDVTEETNDNDIRKLKISVYTKTTGKDKLKKEADEEHFEEQTELLDNQVKKEQSKISLHKPNNKVVSEAAEKSAVPDNIVDKKNTDMQKKEFAYNGYVLSQREKKIFKHTSQEQQFKFDKHRDLIIKQRRDFAYKQSYKDKLDTRHTYYAELATKTAKEAYDRFKNQDEDAASESRNQSLGDMTNDQVRHTVNSVGNTAKNTAPAINSTTITEENPFILWLWAKKTLKTVSILRWLMLTAPESTSSSAPYMKKQAWHFLRPTITAASKNTSG